MSAARRRSRRRWCTSSPTPILMRTARSFTSTAVAEAATEETTMKVSEALATRISARAFLDKPVPKEIVLKILEGAARAPSGGNLQPWHVWVIAGDEMKRFKALIAEKLKTNPAGEETEYHIYPPNLKEPYRSRRYKCGEDLYATINIPRENKPARLMQLAKNYQFFGAPVGLFFAIDRDMQQGQWADLGMYMQSI